MIVTIDGPAAAGKSTVARGLAARLGFDYLDTGATYRAATWQALADGIDMCDAAAVARAAAEAKIEFLRTDAGQRVLCNGRDVTELIRKPVVTDNVFRVADQPDARKALIRRQVEYARGRDVVTEGRDQGTEVFAGADVKFYLDASLSARAGRRLKDLRKLGISETFENVRAQIAERDRLDMARPVGALRQSEDMTRIDSTGLSAEQVVGKMAQIVQRRRGAPAGGVRTVSEGQ